MYTCKGITKNNTPCRRKLVKEGYCACHNPRNFVTEKPDECIVCCYDLYPQKYPLNCGHWIHTDCVVKSGKAECPICRQPVTLSDINTKKLLAVERRHRREKEEEEGRELFAQYMQEINRQYINLRLPVQFDYYYFAIV